MIFIIIIGTIHFDYFMQEQNSHETGSENIDTNDTKEIESVRKDESFTNDKITSILQSSEKTNKCSLDHTPENTNNRSESTRKRKVHTQKMGSTV